MYKKEISLQYKIIFFVIGLILVFCVSMVGINLSKSDQTSDIKNDNKENIKDYIYKIRYDFGCESYIYLLPNNIIKTVEIYEIYEPMENCDCMEPTGEYDYKENIIDFSEETKNIVISVFDNLYKRSGKKEINADNLELTKYEERVLLAIMLNSEDNITIEQDLYYVENYEIIKSENKNAYIKNDKKILKNPTENDTINEIANYLNAIVNSDFEDINNQTKDILNASNEKEDNGVKLKIDFVYAGPYSLSFTYTKEGKLGETDIYDIKGYTFKYTGKIHEFDMNGWKDKYYKEALEVFMNDYLYIENSEQLNKDWKSILYNNMFVTGNWYLDDNKIVFLIPANLLGFDESTAKIITISVENIDEF